MYRSANLSMNRSIFCASPGRRKACRNVLKALVNGRLVRSIMSTKACMMAMFSSSLKKGMSSIIAYKLDTHPSPKYSPMAALFNPSVCIKNMAISRWDLLGMNPLSKKYLMPYPSSISYLRCLIKGLAHLLWLRIKLSCSLGHGHLPHPFSLESTRIVFQYSSTSISRLDRGSDSEIDASSSRNTRVPPGKCFR